MWYLCLYATRGTDLRAPLRAGASEEALRALIADTWRGRSDRGAEDAPRAARSLADDSDQLAEERSAPGDAHARRMTRAPSARIDPVECREADEGV